MPHQNRRNCSVLIVDLAKRYGGAEVRVLDTARSLDGRYPYAVATLEGSPLHQRLEAAKLVSLPVPFSRSDPRVLFFVRRAVRQEGYLIVDAHNVQSQFWGHLAAMLAGAKKVSTVHSAYRLEHNNSLKGRMYELVLRLNAQAGGRFVVESKAGNFEGKTVVVATGAHPRLLRVPGEEEFTGKGVTYCATCDAPLFNGKEVAVVGGGNSGLEAAIQLFNFAAKIYLLHRHEKLKGDQVLIDRVEKNEKVMVLPESEILEIRGGQFVELIKVKQAGEEKELKVGGVFVNIGLTPETDFAKGLVEMNESGEIKVDFCNNTNVPGLFAAGDCTCVPHKQIIVAGGEGCKAALSAAKFLNMSGEY